MKECVYLHPGDAADIEIPNEHAACITHHVALTQVPPEPFDSRFDVPGTVVQRFNAKDIGLPTHTLAPYLNSPRKKRPMRDVMSESDWSDYDLFDKLEALCVTRVTDSSRGGTDLFAHRRYDKAKKHFFFQLTGDKQVRKMQRRGATAMQVQ